VIEQDDLLVGFDNQRLIEALRATDGHDRLHYEHLRPHEGLALAYPDVAAWCWVRSGEWRRRVTPILGTVRTVRPSESAKPERRRRPAGSCGSLPEAAQQAT